jgi:Putative Ig domain/Right handed beta helix region/Glucodextranase, domain B
LALVNNTSRDARTGAANIDTRVRLTARPGSLILATTWLAVLLLPTPTWTQPGARYVNPVDRTCLGRAPCYTTIQAAVNAALPGERIELQPGTYREQVAISGKNARTGATESDRIVIHADPGAPPGNVVVTPPAASCANGHAFRLQKSRFVTLRGLTIAGARGPAVALAGGDGQNQAIHLERLRVFANGSSTCGGGIAIGQGNPGTLVANSLVHANGRNGIAFIDDGGPHLVIQNTIHANQWNGVDVARGHEVFLVNNAITANGTAQGVTGGRFGILHEASAPPLAAAIHLWNNLVCGNRLGEIAGPALDPTDAGNLTPSGAEGRGVSAAPGCGRPGAVYQSLTGVDGVADSIDDDFRLAPGSPAIDSGMDPRTLGLPLGLGPVLESDFAGAAARPKDGNRTGTPRFDMGALEFAPANRPPVANAGPDRTVASDTITNLDGTASFDPDGDPITFQWSQTAGPAVRLTNVGSATPGFVSPHVSDRSALTFRLLVSDGVLSSAASVNVFVTPAPNRAPTIDPVPDQTVTVGNTLTFTVAASDPDGDRLTLSAAPLPLPANATFDTATGVFTFAPTPTQLGSYPLTFTATDGRGGSASRTATVSVVSGLQLTITSPSAGESVAASVVIVRGTVQAGGADVGVAVNGITAAVQGASFATMVPVDSTVSSLTATAVTGSGATASQTIPISVSAPSREPLLLASPIAGTAPLRVSFSLIGGPPPASITLDLTGDGTADFAGATLDGELFTFPTPGLYFPTAQVIDTTGTAWVLTAIVQVLDPVQLDALLQSKWAALKDFLRVGDIAGALQFIVEGARSGYDEAFRAIASRLPQIDTILTGISGLTAHNSLVVYDAERSDDGVPMRFEVRFAIDSDGLWRLQSF